jgi:hypothetical protein
MSSINYLSWTGMISRWRQSLCDSYNFSVPAVSNSYAADDRYWRQQRRRPVHRLDLHQRCAPQRRLYWPRDFMFGALP